jgi:hypothetical protein
MGLTKSLGTAPYGSGMTGAMGRRPRAPSTTAGLGVLASIFGVTT